MAGKMRKRKRAANRNQIRAAGNLMKSFHAPQKDNSKRQKKRYGGVQDDAKDPS